MKYVYKRADIADAVTAKRSAITRLAPFQYLITYIE
jgi:hypothetical protein